MISRTPKFSDAQIEAALRASGGIYTGAAVRLECAPNTIKNYVERSEDLQEIVRQVVEENLDMAETTLLTAIRDKSLTAVIFYLKTKGKHRGYSEGRIVSGPNGGPVPVSHGFNLADLRKLSTEHLLALESAFAAVERRDGRDDPVGEEPESFHPPALAPD